MSEELSSGLKITSFKINNVEIPRAEEIEYEKGGNKVEGVPGYIGAKQYLHATTTGGFDPGKISATLLRDKDGDSEQAIATMRKRGNGNIITLSGEGLDLTLYHASVVGSPRMSQLGKMPVEFEGDPMK